jgi:predicted ester cyclase
MSVEEQKALIHRLFDEGVNRRNLKVIEELVSPTLTVGADLPDGPEGVKAIVEWLHSVFGDLEYRVEDVVAEADKVVARLSARGIHQGEYVGHHATGKLVTYDEVMIVRLASGQIVEWWIVADKLAILEQIGVIPPPDN